MNDKYRYNIDLRKKLYDQIQINLPKGTRDTVKEHALTQGESLNQFILRAIRETIERDKE